MSANALVAVTVVLAFWPGNVQARQEQDEKRRSLREAENKIKEYKSRLRKAANENDIVSAIRFLGEKKHPKILLIHARLLRHPKAEIRQEAAGQLGEYEGDRAAESTLLSGASKEKDAETLASILGAVGRVGLRSSNRNLSRFFGHASRDVAGAAVEAAGAIGSRDSIQPLISLLKTLDATEGDFSGRESER